MATGTVTLPPRVHQARRERGPSVRSPAPPPDLMEEEGPGGAPGRWGSLTRLAHGELHRAPRVEQLLDQRLGQHGGREEDRPAALAVESTHQAVGDQAEVPAELALGVQLWEGTGKGQR